MKVVYVTTGIAPYVTGGIQAVARRQITGLVSGGVEVVYIHSYRGMARESSDLPGAEHVLNYPFSRGFRRWSPWHYPNELKAYSEQVDRIVEQERPDVVYSEGALVHRTLLRPDRPPVVFHPHGLDMYQDQKSLVRNLRAHTMRPLFAFHARKADRVLCQGGHLMELLVDKIGVPAERVAVLPNAVPVTVECLPKRRSGEILKCLFVGRDDPKKGFRLLRQAIAEVNGVSLDVVGMEGIDTNRTRWHGVVRDVDRIREFYRSADVLVLPSYSEGMATVLLEAMQAGTPCIATDVGASGKVVIDGRTGWLIQPGSISVLTEAMRKAVALKDEDYLRFSGECIGHMNNNFSAAVVNRRLEEVLREAIGDNS